MFKKVEATLETIEKFSYKKGGMVLSFSIDSGDLDNAEDFLQLLQRGVEDVTKLIERMKITE